MPYKCSKCGEPITEEQVTKTVEKFGNALCNKCILASVEDSVEGAPSAPDEEPEQQTHVDDGKYNDVPMLKHNEPAIASTIKGLTPQLCECGKIKIGKKGSMITSQHGNNFRPPEKIDHFLITTTAKDKNGDFVPDTEIMDEIGDNCTKLNVTVMYDKPELIFPTSYARYDSAVCQCRGDGNNARDAKTGTLIKCNPETCKFAIDKKCKPNGILSVILEDSPRVGGVYKFRTTSWNSIRNITSSLEFIRSLTGGYLAGLPLVLTMQPKTTVIPGTKKTTTIYMVNIEYRGTLTEMREHTIRIATQKATMMDEIARIEDAALLQITAPESAEECTDVQEEFYPETIA
jgi:hypothetical protein